MKYACTNFMYPIANTFYLAYFNAKITQHPLPSPVFNIALPHL